MRERNAVIILVVILIVIGASFVYFTLFKTEFNFYKSEINIEGTKVTEKLSFKPDKPYHTLYRDFVSTIQPYDSAGNYGQQGATEVLTIESVLCSEGQNYFRTRAGRCYQTNKDAINQATCLPYTENNEAGCTFGNTYGFQKGENYEIQATYFVQMPAVIKINGENYLKLVAYSGGRHPLLITGKNFFVNNQKAIVKKLYFPSERVELYIPYVGSAEGAQILNESFRDNSWLMVLLYLLLAFVPSIVLFFVWYFFGKETSKAELPETISYWPQTKRKAWEVASYFHPPFGVMDREFFAATLLDFAKRKIVLLKTKDKKVWIKLPDKEPKNLDKIESEFFELLLNMRDSLVEYFSGENFKGKVRAALIGYRDKYIDEEGFVDLKMLVSYARTYRTEILKLQKEIKRESKNYIDFTGEYTFQVILIALLIFGFYILHNVYFSIATIFTYFIFSIILRKSALLVRFKKDFYKEYQHWQVFRGYLKEFPSMKESPHEAVVLWEQYLVYATALGVSEKVLKKLKEWKVINDNQYIAFHAAYVSSGSFATSAGTSGGGGGVGGGGAGGGGGGGR